MTRPDIEAALQRLPVHVSEQLMSAGQSSLGLLTNNLPTSEQVIWLASAAPSSFNATELHCLFAVTDRRLLFVAPAPQVLSWQLPTVTKTQSLQGKAGQIVTFFVDDATGGQYQLGTDGQWGPAFADHAKRAIAEATLRNM